MKTISAKDRAAMLEQSIFQGQVRDVRLLTGEAQMVAKKSTNSKLGKKVFRGTLEEYYIYTITFEERATCPRVCEHWKNCYGNNMRNGVRFGTRTEEERQAVIAQIEKDLAHWQKLTDKRNAERAKKKIPLAPIGFLVRVHVLGDFFSVEYANMWRKWLNMFPSMVVFGYSRWLPEESEIGDALLSIRNEFGMNATTGGRFCLHFSSDKNHGSGALSADVDGVLDLVESGDAFICPEQQQSEERANGPNPVTCGSCTKCFDLIPTRKTKGTENEEFKHVVFLTH